MLQQVQGKKNIKKISFSNHSSHKGNVFDTSRNINAKLCQLQSYREFYKAIVSKTHRGINQNKGDNIKT